MLLFVASLSCKYLIMAPRVSYYAVRKGRIPGVYSTWAEAEQQVTGYSSACFKKFSSEREALSFIHGHDGESQGGAAISNTKPKGTQCYTSIYIYTDGSCKLNSNVANNNCRAGWGAVITKRSAEFLACDETLVDELYGPVVTDSSSLYYLGAEYGHLSTKHNNLYIN